MTFERTLPQVRMNWPSGRRWRPFGSRISISSVCTCPPGSGRGLVRAGGGSGASRGVGAVGGGRHAGPDRGHDAGRVRREVRGEHGVHRRGVDQPGQRGIDGAGTPCAAPARATAPLSQATSEGPRPRRGDEAERRRLPASGADDDRRRANRESGPGSRMPRARSGTFAPGRATGGCPVRASPRAPPGAGGAPGRRARVRRRPRRVPVGQGRHRVAHQVGQQLRPLHGPGVGDPSRRQARRAERSRRARPGARRPPGHGSQADPAVAAPLDLVGAWAPRPGRSASRRRAPPRAAPADEVLGADLVLDREDRRGRPRRRSSRAPARSNVLTARTTRSGGARGPPGRRRAGPARRHAGRRARG